MHFPIKENEVITPEKVNATREVILKKYRDEGFFHAYVKFEMGKINPKTNLVKVKFIIDEGDEIPVSKINIIGTKAVDQLFNERKEVKGEMAYKYPIDLNVIPQIDVFLDNGYTKEEMKMVKETCKIMQDESIKVTATTVRIPVVGGHSESLNVEFENEFDLGEVTALLAGAPGIIVQNDDAAQVYPMPLWAHEKDEVFVGRLRRDETQPKTLNMWVVSDNLRKGAATNAVQIAEYKLAKNLLG